MIQAKLKKESAIPLGKKILKNAGEISFICLVALSLFLFIALVDFDQHDNAWSHSSSSALVHNSAGIVGAWFADVLLYLLGYIGYTFPLILAYAGFGIFKSARKKQFYYGHYAICATGFILLLLSACGLACLHFVAGDELPLSITSAGGLLGSNFGNSLNIIFGFTGGTLILLTMFIIGTTLFTGISWLQLMDIIGDKVFQLLYFLSALYKKGRDYNLGRQAKRNRDKSVESEKKKQDRRGTIKIEPVISEFVVSDREFKEKQVVMFETANAVLPSLDLLASPPPSKGHYSNEALAAISRQIELKLKDFGIEAQVVEVSPGPVITRFEIQPAAGIKGSQVINLSKDIARSLSVVSVRVVDIIPGKSVIGLELPNEHRELVALSDILRSKEYDNMKSRMTIGLGKNINGQPMVADLAKMPHLLVAGTTGAGKSVALNVMILSLLYKSTVKETRLIMIDPKMLELSVYQGIPHLLAPVVTDMKEAANALRWCVAEMERRYRLMADIGVRNISGYNRKVEESEQNNTPIIDSTYKPVNEEEQPRYLEPLPFIVVIVDELADMMMTTGKKVEELIARLAQKARAAGIHLILATQRPSVDVITGLIKANIPSRIAFQVSSKVDSRTILDQMGAEALLGHGDMLYLPAGSSVPERIHGAFVDDHEVHAVVEDIKSRGQPDYNDDILKSASENGTGITVAGSENEQDPLYDEAVKIVIETRKASISYIQRRLKIGYNRAARIVEEMESSGLVSATNASGNREVLVPTVE